MLYQRASHPPDATGPRSTAASDSRSAAADNTSAFNCRYAVAAGPETLVRTRLRRGDRRQHRREPVHRGGTRDTPRRRALSRPFSRPAWDGGCAWRPRGAFAVGGLELGRSLGANPGLPALLAERQLGDATGAGDVLEPVGAPRATGTRGARRRPARRSARRPTTTAGTAPISAAAAPTRTRRARSTPR